MTKTEGAKIVSGFEKVVGKKLILKNKNIRPFF